jgi:hypothetical protein
MAGPASASPRLDQQHLADQGTRQRVTITLYLDPHSARSQDLEQELTAAARRYPARAFEWDVRYVSREAMRAEGLMIAATPMLLMHGPSGSHIVLGRLNADAVHEMFATNGIVRDQDNAKR